MDGVALSFLFKVWELSSWATLSQPHKVPHTYWLVATYIYSKYCKIGLPAPKSSCLQGCFLLEGLRRALVSLLFLSF